MTVYRCNICGIEYPKDELESGVCLDCLASIVQKDEINLGCGEDSL